MHWSTTRTNCLPPSHTLYPRGRESCQHYILFSAKSSLNLMCWAGTDYRRKENIISKAIKSFRNYVGWCTLVLTLMPAVIFWKIWLISIVSLPTHSKKRSNALLYHNNHLFWLRMCTDYSNSRRELRTFLLFHERKRSHELFIDAWMLSSMCQLWGCEMNATLALPASISCWLTLGE